jgi:SAM-dependent methyltransferase
MEKKMLKDERTSNGILRSSSDNLLRKITKLARVQSTMLRAQVVYSTKILCLRLLNPNKSIFSVIHDRQMWGGESRSGAGSSFEETLTVQQELPKLVREIGVRSVLDAACGDYYWMKEVNLDVDHYVGVDIVPEMIARNQAMYGSDKVSFMCADIKNDVLPKVDLIICRDVLVHLSFKDGKRAIDNFRRSGSKYLLTTSYPGLLTRNRNIFTGMWRPIDLRLPPYSFPPEIAMLNEKTTEAADYTQKSLGLWAL